MKIQVGKSYQTRDGNRNNVLDVRIGAYLEDINGSYKYVGTNNGNVLSYFNEEGRSVGGNYNLLPNTVKKEGWTNLYRRNNGIHAGLGVHDTKDKATRHHKNKGYVATVRVEWEEEV